METVINDSLHNLLSGRFIRDVVGPAIRSGASDSELMVLFESIQTSMLEVLHKHYDQPPHVAVGLVESSLHNAIERFADLRKAGK